MTIQAAAVKAHELGTGMYRLSEFEEGTYIIPTNTCSCCIVSSTRADRAPASRWEPMLGDLLATDWEVYGLLRDKLG